MPLISQLSALFLQIDEFRGVEYSASVADFFTYDNLRPEEDWHPKIKDIVYWGKCVYAFTVNFRLVVMRNREKLK